jgi:hypothetical protein
MLMGCHRINPLLTGRKSKQEKATKIKFLLQNTVKKVRSAWVKRYKLRGK